MYLGGFDNEVQAAKAHDAMAIKCRGLKTIVNFKTAVYQELLPFLQDATALPRMGEGARGGKTALIDVLNCLLDYLLVCLVKKAVALPAG